METYDGSLWAEPNPLPEDTTVPLQLPTVSLPEDVDTIPMAEAGRAGRKEGTKQPRPPKVVGEESE
jgi:lysine 2,3-aminomutase